MGHSTIKPGMPLLAAIVLAWFHHVGYQYNLSVNKHNAG